MDTPRFKLSMQDPFFFSARAAYQRAEDKYIGRKVEIISEYFNGQPYGRSKRKLKGTITRIKSVSFDMHWGMSFELENDENWCYIGIEGVKFL